MRLCDKTLEVLRDLITGDDKRIEYRGGKELVELFNKLGFHDSYGQGFPSRSAYTKDRLEVINGTPELDACIKLIFSPVNFIGKKDVMQATLQYFNEYLAFDGWNVIIQGRDVSFKKASDFEIQADARSAHTEDEFLSKQFDDIDFSSLSLEAALIPVLKQRMDEIKTCMEAGAYLAVVILCGSTLEGILLGIANNYPKSFNEATAAPKDKSGKVKPFQDWTLANYIDAACDAGFIDLDIKKFSHTLRDFRNYIHPYEQMLQRFNPTEDTARICLQVLKGALNQLSRKCK